MEENPRKEKDMYQDTCIYLYVRFKESSYIKFLLTSY